MTQQLRINSIYRQNYATTNANNFTTQSFLSLTGKWALTYGQIPVGPNITPNNNILNFTDGSGTHVATIPVGYYTPTTLATAVQTAMNTVSSAVYTVTLGANTGLLSMSVNEGNFSLLFGTYTPTGYYANPGATLAAILGYAQADTISATNAVATTPVNLTWNRNVNLQIDNLPINSVTDTNSLGNSSQGTGQGGGGKNWAFAIGIGSGVPGSIYEYIPNLQHQTINFGPGGFNSFQIRVYGDDGQLYDFNGMNWDIILRKVED